VLAPVLLVAAVLRLALPIAAFVADRSTPPLYSPDSWDYVGLARNLADTFSFSRNGVVEVFRAPGYPLLLAIASLTGHLTATAVLIQVALGVATVALVYGIAAGSGNKQLALTAGWIAACEPLLVMYCGSILTETLFTTLLLASLFVWLRTDISPRWRFAVVAVLASALALVRPVGYLVPFLYAASALFASPDRAWSARLRGALIVMAVATMMLGAWHVRNARVANFWGFTAQVERQTYLTSAVWLTAKAEGRSFQEVRSDFMEDVRRATGDPDERGARFTREARERGLRFVRSHLLAILRLQFAGSLLVILEPPRGENTVVFGRDSRFTGLRGYALSHSPLETLARLATENARVILWLAILGGYWLLFLAVVVIGAIRLRHLPILTRHLGLTTVAVHAYLLLASGGYFGQARFRHPLMPILCIVAAVGVQRLRDGYRPSGHDGRLTIASARA
jgi:4-amino-4-deoxy-L-arabinose transferase-like glycosyltransferase